MNRSDTSKILTKMAAYDQRTIGLADVAAWHEIIGELDYGDCLTAVRDYYTESRDRCMPADIVKRVKAIQSERSRAVGALRPNDTEDDMVELRALNAAVRSGRMNAADVRAYEASALPVFVWLQRKPKAIS
jgi:hypothetical protein